MTAQRRLGAVIASVVLFCALGFAWLVFPYYLLFYLLALAVGLTIIWRPARA